MADIEIKKEDFDMIKEEFKSEKNDAANFEPSCLPDSIWNTIKSGSSHVDTYRRRNFFQGPTLYFHGLSFCSPALNIPVLRTDQIY